MITTTGMIISVNNVSALFAVNIASSSADAKAAMNGAISAPVIARNEVNNMINVGSLSAFTILCISSTLFDWLLNEAKIFFLIFACEVLFKQHTKYLQKKKKKKKEKKKKDWVFII